MVSNSLSSRLPIAAFAIVMLASLARAQAPDPDIFWLSANVPAFVPYANIPLRLGDGFTAGGGKITVKLVGNEADNTGSLYFINPITGKERFLFTNKTGGQPTVDLGDFPKGAPIVFKYITDLAKKNTYTGANQAGTYNFDSDPALATLAVNHQAMPVSAVAVRNGDKRWACAGRVDATKVVFGFEDQVGIDPDFNDIVFLVTGVGLDTEIKLSPPVISGETPFKERSTVTITAPAGGGGGEKVFYTTDGSAPTFDAAGLPTGTTKEYAGPFDITQNTTVTAVTWKQNEAGSGIKYAASETVVKVFTKLGKLDPVVANPPGGTTWSDGLDITLTQAQGGEIHYVLCDPKAGLPGGPLPCADPTRASPTYLGPVDLTRPTVLKAIAYKDGFVESDVLTASYLLTLQVVSAVYLDENGDGRIDAARVVLSGKAATLPEALVFDDPFKAGSSVTVPKSRLTVDPADPNAVIARFPETPFAFGTAFPEKEYGHVPAGSDAFPAQDFKVGDAVGPVVVSAEATPAVPLEGKPATLKVVFSEDVVIDPNSKEFPFHVKRAVGADPNGQVVVDHVVNEGNRTYEYVFAATSPRYPVDGDSLRLLTTPAVQDVNHQQSHMTTYVPVKGAPSSLKVDIGTDAGDWVKGGTVIAPRPVAIPISVIQPPLKGTHDWQNAVPVCLDCRTGEWKATDPSRPANFPAGPTIQVTTKGAFSFDLAFYDHLGAFVNRAKGKVSEAMLAGLPADAQGNKVVGLMWYPVTHQGAQAATGAYIVLGTITSLEGQTRGSQGEIVNLSGMTTGISRKFGYVRR